MAIRKYSSDTPPPDNATVALPSAVRSIPERDHESWRSWRGCLLASHGTVVLTACSLNNSSPTRWLEFLDEVFASDTELVGYVQRLLGYSLLGTVREHVLPVCWGRGANGKGTLFETVQEVLGDYAAPA